ncbi:MAG: DegT/DnrJ/EryC1/StrS family aminotransferase, partial [Planctomycetota bacterium]
PRGKAFEAACAERLQASHAVACASGSAALEIALRGLGIGPGDEVIVPTLTWVATGMAVLQVGARPVFCDVDPTTHNATVESVSRAWSPRTRAVVCVDFAGVPADVEGLRRLCDERGAGLVEDAAHSFGATHPNGRPVGTDGAAHVATFSFHPAKTITTAEGGLLTTSNAPLAERLRRIRSGGLTRDFDGSRGGWDCLATEVGGNFHLNELSAAIGLVQLERVDELLELRAQAYADLYDALEPLASAGRLARPTHPAGSSHNLFVVELEERFDRDAVLRGLADEQVRAHVHYPLLHRQPVFASQATDRQALLWPEASYEVAECHVERALSLPLFAGLTQDQIDQVATALERVLERPAVRRDTSLAA